MHPIPVRKMAFDIPTSADLDPKWFADDIHQSYLSTGISLYVAYLEPFLVKSMRRVLDKITDPELKECVDRFARQEAQHYHQHEQFNTAILDMGYPGLQERFDQLKNDFNEFVATRDDKWCVGFVEGFEALTTQFALLSLQQIGKGHPKTDPRFLALFEWHMAEEVEHRNVAFDVYEHLFGDYWFRVKMCWTAQHHILDFITDVMAIMSPTDVKRYDKSYHSGPIDRALVWIVTAPMMIKTMLPWYSPHHYRVPENLQRVSAQLTAQAQSVS